MMLSTVFALMCLFVAAMITAFEPRLNARSIRLHDRAAERKIVGIQTVDHPTDGRIIAHARKYFGLGERVRSP
jgi:hypothetical protein